MRPGDLAVVVNSASDNDGMIVRCKQRLGFGPWKRPSGPDLMDAGWKVWPAIPLSDGTETDQIPDSQLIAVQGLSRVLGVK